MRGRKGLKWGGIFLPVFLLCTAEERKCEFDEKALWSEFISYSAVKGSFSYVKESGYSIYLAIDEGLIGDPALLDLLMEAEEEGIKIGAWLLLSYENGYWPNEKNAEKFLKAVKDFVEWKEEKGFKIDRIIVDMETSYGRIKELENAAKNGDFFYIIQDLLRNFNPAEFSYAKSIYRNLVRWLHTRGIKVMVTTSPFIIDDLADGDEDISDMLDTPVNGIEWDVLSFMVYRTLYRDFLGVMPSSYLTYSYAESATSLFGNRVAIDLGITGEEYGREEIEDDLRSLCFLGIREFHIYALDYISTLSNPGEFLKFQVYPEEPPFSFSIDVLRRIIRSLDGGYTGSE